MKILIVGGCVAGPGLAGLLKAYADITLIDKAPKWGNIGYAISLWGNGQRVLRTLGIDHTVLKGGYEVPWNAFETKLGEVLKVFTFDMFKSYGQTTVVTRTSLQEALTKNMEDKVRIKMGIVIVN